MPPRLETPATSDNDGIPYEDEVDYDHFSDLEPEEAGGHQEVVANQVVVEAPVPPVAPAGPAPLTHRQRKRLRQQAAAERARQARLARQQHSPPRGRRSPPPQRDLRDHLARRRPPFCPEHSHPAVTTVAPLTGGPPLPGNLLATLQHLLAVGYTVGGAQRHPAAGT